MCLLPLASLLHGRVCPCPRGHAPPTEQYTRATLLRSQAGVAVVLYPPTDKILPCLPRSSLPCIPAEPFGLKENNPVPCC